MRLLVVGRLSGQLASAVKMAMAHGAKVNHVERADQATEQLRRGQGAGRPRVGTAAGSRFCVLRATLGTAVCGRGIPGSDPPGEYAPMGHIPIPEGLTPALT